MTDAKKIELLTEVINKYKEMGSMTKMKTLEWAEWTRDERFNVIFSCFRSKIENYPQIAVMGQIDEIGVFLTPPQNLLIWDEENYKVVKKIIDTGVWMELPPIPEI